MLLISGLLVAGLGWVFVWLAMQSRGGASLLFAMLASFYLTFGAALIVVAISETPAVVQRDREA